MPPTIDGIFFIVARETLRRRGEVARRSNSVNEGLGIALIDKAPRKGAEGLNIAFLHPKSTAAVLTELCENPNK